MRFIQSQRQSVIANKSVEQFCVFGVQRSGQTAKIKSKQSFGVFRVIHISHFRRGVLTGMQTIINQLFFDNGGTVGKAVRQFADWPEGCPVKLHWNFYQKTPEPGSAGLNGPKL